MWDNEGVKYQKAQLKIMGIEAVKSSTPAPCRAKIKEGLNIIMSGDEKQMNKFIQESPPHEKTYSTFLYRFFYPLSESLSKSFNCCSSRK